MARALDPYRLSSPQVFLWRMMIFLIIVGFLAFILYRQIYVAFEANPGLNGVILGVLVIGCVLAVRQVIRLFPEIRWVNAFRLADPGATVRGQPRLLGPMAALLRDRSGELQLRPETARSILDSIALRLDESRDLTRYIGGLLVFLGLLGTFWGLTDTVSSIGRTIQSLTVGSNDLGVVFDDLKNGLAAPLAGMGTAFSSSLFGLAGSLVIGFLDLQASQAQNRFYNELEEWLSAVTDPDYQTADRDPSAASNAAGLRLAVERLIRVVQDNQGSRAQTSALVGLAEGIQDLVQQMRSEQQLIRSWVENQSEQTRDLQRAVEEITGRGEDRTTAERPGGERPGAERPAAERPLVERIERVR